MSTLLQVKAVVRMTSPTWSVIIAIRRAITSLNAVNLVEELIDRRAQTPLPLNLRRRPSLLQSPHQSSVRSVVRKATPRPIAALNLRKAPNPSKKKEMARRTLRRRTRKKDRTKRRT